MNACLSFDKQAGKYWTRCQNILTVEPCACKDSGCEDRGVGPFCYVQSQTCAVKEPCEWYAEGKSCIGMSGGTPWTRCRNILNAHCTVYDVTYPLLGERGNYLSGRGG